MDSKAAFGIGLAVGVSIVAITFGVLNPIASSLPQVKPSSQSTVTLPVIHGYYNGADIFFIHTEASDKEMAKRLTNMVNYPTLYAPAMADIAGSTSAKVYVFKNGIKGTGQYGGGPFGFQDDVFNSVPADERYSPFRIPYLVVWKDTATPRLLKSAEEIADAERKGELTVTPTNAVVNMPMIKWPVK